MPARTHGMSRTPMYVLWTAIIQRCTNPHHARYADYGGRGITICDQWRYDFTAFYRHVGDRPPGKSIDRIDNDRGYEPSNLRWVTRRVNDRNRSSNRHLTHQGETLTVAEWCERLGLPRDTVGKRLASGWSDEEALSTPVRAKAPNGAGARAGGAR